MFDVTHAEVRGAVERALAEDIGSGDKTTQLTVPEGRQARGFFLAKQNLTVGGIELLPLVYEIAGGGVAVQLQNVSGEQVESGRTLAAVHGSARTLLTCERTALNFVQRLSGVATLAHRFVQQVAGTDVKVLDTRKTTPGLRQLEKMAVVAGGATNHRRGLFDAVLIKNNHITAAGGVRQALAAARAFSGPIQIEVRTFAELDEALGAGAQALLLDNLTPAEAADWIRHIRQINQGVSVEVSGGINLQSIRSYAEAGPDYISCGAMTHSATAVDISFRLVLE